MPLRNYRLFIPLVGALLLSAAVWLWTAQTANAQCGSQASSCKNCHEVQAQQPVNNDGTRWHPSHAFGDFCANCHAGNVQATEKDAAHTGMVAPLSDVQANCAACHPDDLQDRAQQYASVLGVDFQLGGGSSAGGGQPSGDEPVPTAAPDTSSSASAAVVNEPGVIDYTQRYDETVLGIRSVNWGNVIVGVLIVAVLAGGGVYVYWNERRLRGKSPIPTLKPQVTSARPVAVEDYPKEVVELLPRLARLNPLGLHALKRLLENPEEASELLHSLSRLDPDLVRRIRALDREGRALLLALGGD